MSSSEDKSTSIGERRRASRRDSDIQLEVQLDSNAIRGQAENISTAGVFFFSRDPLNVTVKIHDGTSSQSYTGKLVRVERLSPETTGYAIEFDRL
jgi:hypothetical protein